MSARSVYVSRLRRAFLLRVHPDRFTDQIVRNQQASLVQALANRMSMNDFTAWQQQQNGSTSRINDMRLLQQQHLLNQYQHQSFPYILEKRDGTFLKTSLSLSTDVDTILASMSDALHQSGAASLPVPPVPLYTSNRSKLDPFHSSTNQSHNNNMSNADIGRRDCDSSVNHQFDKQSNEGRNLRNFLWNTKLGSSLRQEIQIRIQHRTDAQAVALQVRRLYQFAAVDATLLGWSRKSVAVLLRRLVALHAEYSNRVAPLTRMQQFNHHHTTNLRKPLMTKQPSPLSSSMAHNDSTLLLRSTYYPLRLHFSSHEVHDVKDDALDMYGGLLRLNPASTSIQWLETLQLVTDEKLQQVLHYREILLKRTRTVQGLLGIQIKKGYTCSNRDYHTFLERLAEESLSGSTPVPLQMSQQQQEQQNLLPMLEPVIAIVESDATCRRPKLTGPGHIRLGSGMNLHECQYAIRRLSDTAREHMNMDINLQHQCRQVINAVQWQLGLQKIYRTVGSRVSHQQFLDSLSRLLQVHDMEMNRSHESESYCLTSLGGNSLAIAPTDQSCRLADDGAIVIPHNWT